jgi:16S rRNA (guanine1516-N2)-methyltransferase
MDPMYPVKKKSAKSRKEMELFKSIVGTDDDADELFEFARKREGARVVVKRPLHGVFVDKSCTRSFKGKSTRYDMYI